VVDRFPAAPVSSAVANPTYTSIVLEININKPAADVWKRVGKYAIIGEWLQVPCTITSGKDAKLAPCDRLAARSLVGKTELSYTYTQPVRANQPYNLYHGTVDSEAGHRGQHPKSCTPWYGITLC
jgi:hypothetical protein